MARMNQAPIPICLSPSPPPTLSMPTVQLLEKRDLYKSILQRYIFVTMSVIVFEMIYFLAIMSSSLAWENSSSLTFFIIMEPMRIIMCVWCFLFVDKLRGLFVVLVFAVNLVLGASITFFINELAFGENVTFLIRETAIQAILLVLNIVILDFSIRQRQIYHKLDHEK